MADGTLIAEGLRLNASIEGLSLTVRKVARFGPLPVPSGQPNIWTFIEFAIDDEDAPALASALAASMEADLGWYCDFRTETETFVVFADRVFRYRRGDPDGRAHAESHARSFGVPESQLDWPE